MVVLSPSQLAYYARAGGIPDDKLETMVAAAMTESGSRINAHNPNASTGDNSYGLWQVNMLGDMGPERRRQFGISSNEELFDPLVNARAASQILQSQGLNAWSVIRSGAYRQHLPAARAGVEALLRGEVGDLPAPPAAMTLGSPGVASPQAADPTAGLAQQLLRSFAPKPPPVARNPGELAAVGLETTFADAAGLKGRGSRAGRMALSPEFIAGYSDLLQQQGQQPGGDLLSQTISKMFGSQAVSDAPAATPAALPSAAGGASAGILDLAAGMQRSGLRVREHPALGGVGRHSPNSLHYSGRAVDVTDWQFPDEAQASWLPRKKFLGERIAGILGDINAEVLHPGNDPAGHGTHIHVGLRQPELLTTGHIEAIVKARQEALSRFPARWAG